MRSTGLCARIAEVVPVCGSIRHRALREADTHARPRRRDEVPRREDAGEAPRRSHGEVERSAHEPFQQGCRVRHVPPRRVVRDDSREGAHCSGRENVFHVSSGNMSPFFKVRNSPTASVRSPQVWKTDGTHPSQQSIRNAVLERKKKGARWDGEAGTQKSGSKNKVNRPLIVVCSSRQRRRAAGRRWRPRPS